MEEERINRGHRPPRAFLRVAGPLIFGVGVH
jgi:hypothetical protein